MSAHLVTIKTVTYPHELALIRGYLEAEGVECFVQDEMMAQVYNFYSNAIGGIKLQVREEDLDRAMRIMRDGGFLAPEDFVAPRETNPFTRLFTYLFGKKQHG